MTYILTEGGGSVLGLKGGKVCTNRFHMLSDTCQYISNGVYLIMTSFEILKCVLMQVMHIYTGVSIYSCALGSQVSHRKHLMIMSGEGENYSSTLGK